MNKDQSSTLTTSDRFNLYLSIPAIDRELSRVKRPSVNVESLPKRAMVDSAPSRLSPNLKTKGTPGRKPKNVDNSVDRKPTNGVRHQLALA